LGRLIALLLFEVNQQQRRTIMTDNENNIPEIAALNDRFRASLGILCPEIPGKVVKTAGIAALCPDDQAAIFNKVREFSDFTEDNDPHGERDFGAFDHAGQRVFWKIDYYAPDMRYGSEDPADLTNTVRVLTILFAHEW
jgi:hypothetical protein